MLRTLTFADTGSGIWGAAWTLGDDHGGFALVGGHSASLDDDWRLTGDGIELEPASGGVRFEGVDGFDEFVIVRGRIADRTIECLGRRGERPALDPTAYDSIRDVSAWFAADDGLALTSARPQGARGHEDDQLTVSAIEGGQPLAIADPRLSTTYGSDGSPVRASLELWVGQPDQDEDADDGPALHPHRTAGEATADPAGAMLGSLVVQARAFRWHARGHEGSGMYVLARAT